MKSIKSCMDTGQYALETWAACAQTINLRYCLMMTVPFASPRVITELTRMNSEKVVAAMQVCQRLNNHYSDMANAEIDTFKASIEILQPINQQAKENVKRLAAGK